MSELLKNITVRVVGVSYKNNDGTNRQEILSGLSIGDAMLLDYFEYENEPAYAVTDALGNQIGNLPKDLSAHIYQKYRDCYFSVQIDDITGVDGLKYGCIISIDIYDTIPDIIKQDTPTVISVENVTAAGVDDIQKESITASDIFHLIVTFFQLFFSLIKLAFYLACIIALIALIVWFARL